MAAPVAALSLTGRGFSGEFVYQERWWYMIPEGCMWLGNPYCLFPVGFTRLLGSRPPGRVFMCWPDYREFSNRPLLGPRDVTGRSIAQGEK